MINSIFGIVPISDPMWTLLVLGFIGCVAYGLFKGVQAWFQNR
jgi:hypothetical protein